MAADKSFATVAREKDCKLIKSICEKEGANVTYVRRENAIAWQWQVLAHVEFDTTSRATRVVWDEEVAKKAGLSTDELGKNFEEAKAKRRARG